MLPRIRVGTIVGIVRPLVCSSSARSGRLRISQIRVEPDPSRGGADPNTAAGPGPARPGHSRPRPHGPAAHCVRREPASPRDPPISGVASSVVVNTPGPELGGSWFETCSGAWYPRRRPCGVAFNISVLADLNKLAREAPSFIRK